MSQNVFQCLEYLDYFEILKLGPKHPKMSRFFQHRKRFNLALVCGVWCVYSVGACAMRVLLWRLERRSIEGLKGSQWF